MRAGARRGDAECFQVGRQSPKLSIPVHRAIDLTPADNIVRVAGAHAIIFDGNLVKVPVVKLQLAQSHVQASECPLHIARVAGTRGAGTAQKLEPRIRVQRFHRATHQHACACGFSRVATAQTYCAAVDDGAFAFAMAMQFCIQQFPNVQVELVAIRCKKSPFQFDRQRITSRLAQGCGQLDGDALQRGFHRQIHGFVAHGDRAAPVACATHMREPLRATGAPHRIRIHMTRKIHAYAAVALHGAVDGHRPAEKSSRGLRHVESGFIEFKATGDLFKRWYGRIQ